MTPQEITELHEMIQELNVIIQQYQWAVTGLCGAIVAMAAYIVHIHKTYSKEMRELAIEQIQSSTQLATALENNNKLWERFLNMDGRKK